MENYSQRARRVLELAQEEAEELKHDVVGTGHLLLALVKEPGGIGGRVLRDAGLKAPQVRTAIKQRSTAAMHGGRYALSLSDDFQRVITHAVDVMEAHGHHYVGTEHMLLGMLNLPDSTGCAILRDLKLPPEDLRTQMTEILSEPLLTSLMYSQPRAKAVLRIQTEPVSSPEADTDAAAGVEAVDPPFDVAVNLTQALQMLTEAVQKIDAGEARVVVYTAEQDGYRIQMLVELPDDSEEPENGDAAAR
jgi:ATP-dependent Clp protease ATP-binding subunit ClpC